jgi:hypothetical protein
MGRDEKEMETRLCQAILAGENDRTKLASLTLHRSTSEARSLLDLLGAAPYELIQDHSAWNPYPNLMIDLTGGMTPDIVLRSRQSGQNRIYIEVKKTQPLGYGKADSQVVRYLLHLLAMTESKPARIPTDIRRAIILAAPESWFAVSRNAKAWEHFLTTYQSLASSFGVTV